MSERRAFLIHMALAALAAAGAHLAVLSYGFVMDDWPQIAENRRLAGLTLVELFSRGAWAQTEAGIVAGDLYRPLFNLYLSVVARLAGPDPMWFHAAGLMVHMGCSVLVLLVARRLGAGGLAAALIFAVHPIHVANLGGISSAGDSLAALFALAAALLWLDWRARGGQGRLAGVVACCLGSALSKESGVLVPAALLLLELAIPGPIPRRALALTLIGPAVALVGRVFALGATGAEFGLDFSGSNWLRLADLLAYAVQGSVIGAPQPYVFGARPEAFTTWLVLPAALILGAAARMVPRPLALVGLGWLVLFTLPALPLAFNPHAAFATRMLYLSSAGAALILGAALARLPWPALAASVLGLAAATLSLQGIWRDDGAFYSHVIASSPGAGSGYVGLARHHLRRNDAAAAEAVYKAAALAVDVERDRLALVEDHALLLARQGRLAEAGERFQVLADAPFTRVVGLVGLGNVAWAQGDPVRAAERFREVLAIAPGNAEARAGLAAVTRRRY